MHEHPESNRMELTLTVRAHGVASAEPDLSILTFGVVGRARPTRPRSKTSTGASKLCGSTWGTPESSARDSRL